MKLILLHNRAEVHPPGKVYEAKGPPPAGELPTIPEVERPNAYERIFVEPLYTVPLTQFAAKQVPLGEGEAAWTVELTRQYGGKKEDYAARHFPTRSGAFLAGLPTATLERLGRLLRPGGAVYPIPLALAWLAASRKTAVIAFFLRPGYGVVASAQGGEVVEIAETREAVPTLEWVRQEASVQRRILGIAPEEVLVVDSPLDASALPPGIKTASFLDAPLPEGLGWGRLKRESSRLAPLFLAFAAALAVGYLPALYFNVLKGSLKARESALNAEARSLRVTVSSRQALERRRAFLQAVLQTSAAPPVERFLAALPSYLPEEVYVTNFSYDGSSGKMEVFSENLSSLYRLPEALSSAEAKAVTTELRRGAKGWRMVLSFALGGGEQ